MNVRLEANSSTIARGHSLDLPPYRQEPESIPEMGVGLEVQAGVRRRARQFAIGQHLHVACHGVIPEPSSHDGRTAQCQFDRSRATNWLRLRPASRYTRSHCLDHRRR